MRRRSRVIAPLRRQPAQAVNGVANRAIEQILFLKDLRARMGRLDRPGAIAFSGGGDSTALVHMLAGSPIITHALIVDHALREGSADEAQIAAKFAQSLGYQTEIIRWDHDGIKSAVQVRAREYRYAAMGAACRRLGLGHLITAHTADDQAETLIMRKARHTGWRGLAGMPDLAYAPLWPALAEVNLHRPLLTLRRLDLRAYNAHHGLSWIDDPSNENEDFARVRARADLSSGGPLHDQLLEVQTRSRSRLSAESGLLGEWLARHAVIHETGYVTVSKIPPVELLLHLLRAVSGTGGPIDDARRESLLGQMAEPDFKAATLAGAWVRTVEAGYIILRDRVAVMGRRDEAAPTLCQPQSISVDEPLIWDGRFFIRVKAQGFRVKAAQGDIGNLLERSEFKALSNLPPEVRPTLPVIWQGQTPLSVGPYSGPNVSVKSLLPKRLEHRFGHPSMSHTKT